MDHSAISVRYAKAFFMLAKEKNKLEALKTDIVQVLEIASGVKEFVLLLESPVIKTSRKLELIDSIFNDKVDRFTLKFLHLIIKNRRQAHIPGICRHFLQLTRKDQNIQSATLITAVLTDPTSFEKIKLLIEKELNAKVELRNLMDAEIIGGLVLRIEDKQFDASVATQMKRIKQQLLQAELK